MQKTTLTEESTTLKTITFSSQQHFGEWSRHCHSINTGGNVIGITSLTRKAAEREAALPFRESVRSGFHTVGSSIPSLSCLSARPLFLSSHQHMHIYTCKHMCVCVYIIFYLRLRPHLSSLGCLPVTPDEHRVFPLSSPHRSTIFLKTTLLVATSLDLTTCYGDPSVYTRRQRLVHRHNFFSS